MNRGYNTLSLLIGMLLSIVILNLIVSSLKLISNVNLTNNNQDYVSSVQLYSILAHSKNIEVSDTVINFTYLNEDRTLSLVNNKLIMSPGTVIYYTNISDIYFQVVDTSIIFNFKRANTYHKLLVGTYE